MQRYCWKRLRISTLRQGKIKPLNKWRRHDAWEIFWSRVWLYFATIKITFYTPLVVHGRGRYAKNDAGWIIIEDTILASWTRGCNIQPRIVLISIINVTVVITKGAVRVAWKIDNGPLRTANQLQNCTTDARKKRATLAKVSLRLRRTKIAFAHIARLRKTRFSNVT